MRTHDFKLALSILAMITLPGCEMEVPTLESIRDSPLIDRRIKETPREKIVRQCKQESERFRVDCKHCHETNKEEAIQAAANAGLNKVGERTRIMRTSPAFGLTQDCAACHQSKFRLNRAAEKSFGPGGARRGKE